ncbi:unnamed protein product [Owenia fusiformis]|uniref:MAGE domain-containing protein n=1 Tax=Owenia fusiformis TaxID=6347 RepID=A0A8S4NQK8_OWEFU|nr:unnamed protein product [Owenia fusiformis]
MPKNSRKTSKRTSQGRRLDESCSDEEMEVSQVQATQSEATQSNTQAEKATRELDKDTRKRKVNDLVRYMLVADGKKIPIKRTDLTKELLKDHAKAFPVLFDQAKKQLKNIFGIDVVEVEGKKSYMLINTFNCKSNEDPYLKWSDEENAKNGLLTVILSLIFMNGNILEDAELWRSLKKVGVDVDRNHEVFGDVKKLVTQDFVRQNYLEMTRRQPEPPIFDFEWGPRAFAEISKRSILQLVCKIYDQEDTDNSDSNLKMWKSQYRDMEESEGAGEQAD